MSWRRKSIIDSSSHFWLDFELGRKIGKLKLWRFLRPALARGPAFARASGDQFVEHGSLALWTEHPTEPLNVFAASGRTADDDRNVRIGHVDTLVQHSAGHELGVAAVAEP